MTLLPKLVCAWRCSFPPWGEENMPKLRILFFYRIYMPHTPGTPLSDRRTHVCGALSGDETPDSECTSLLDTQSKTGSLGAWCGQRTVGSPYSLGLEQGRQYRKQAGTVSNADCTGLWTTWQGRARGHGHGHGRGEGASLFASLMLC